MTAQVIGKNGLSRILFPGDFFNSYTVSIKVDSTRLKTTDPMITMITITPKLYSNSRGCTEPAPKKA